MRNVRSRGAKTGGKREFEKRMWEVEESESGN